MQSLENNVQTWGKEARAISNYIKRHDKIYAVNGVITCWSVHWKVRIHEMGISFLTSILFDQIAVCHEDCR